MSSEEITTGQVQKAVQKHFEIMFMNPSWDVICDILGDMDPDYRAGTTEYAEIEDYAYGLWGRAKVVFNAEHG